MIHLSLLTFIRPTKFRHFSALNMAVQAQIMPNSTKAESAPWHCAAAAAILLAGLGLLAAPAAADTRHPKPPSGWHLLRTANPHGGPDAVSMSHTADITRSDLDLAGAMLRCGEKGIEIVIVVVTPFPPRARPDVTIGVDGKEWRFDARIVPPGAELLLPAEAMSLAAGPWQSAHELAVKVSSQEQSFGGVIPIEGLADALATLAASCPAG